MARSTNTLALSRRHALAGLAALSTAGIVTAAAASGAQALCTNSAFAEKCRLSRAAKAAMEAHFARHNPSIEAMIKDGPELPKTLLEPLDLPGSGAWIKVPAKGWSADQLSEMVRGFWNVMERSDTPKGMVIREKNLPVPSQTRERAATLRAIREAYDLQHTAWRDEVHRLEDTASELVDEAYDLAFDVMEHPVFTLAELAQKIDIADTMELFASYGGKEDDAREATFRDIRAIAAQEQNNV